MGNGKENVNEHLQRTFFFQSISGQAQALLALGIMVINGETEAHIP